ncbi:hypothetical protein [Dyella mobilis]|uniref:Uncharacterized protein n=1 Tax=Dyella mobilis TaxID=1849582 RepID=A0ABS2KGU2_9GAMM|nr:hypothetical protein [Dyella mobilis]MBM7129972.1 hypothetical protein [Dyella mobilis]
MEHRRRLANVDNDEDESQIGLRIGFEHADSFMPWQRWYQMQIPVKLVIDSGDR